MQPKTPVEDTWRDRKDPSKKFDQKKYDAYLTKKWKGVINEWKSQGCRKCGESRYWVIDAHHIDNSTKSFEIGRARRGLKTTKKELKKCMPLCSNCHKDFHHLNRETGISIEEYVHSQYKINKL